MGLKWKQLQKSVCQNLPLDGRRVDFLDWQHGEPIESQRDTREALLKSHHWALAHQQMAASLFPARDAESSPREEQVERERTDPKWGNSRPEDFNIAPSLVISLSNKGTEKWALKTTTKKSRRRRAEETREEVEELGLSALCVWTKLRKQQLSLREVKTFLPPLYSVKRMYILNGVKMLQWSWFLFSQSLK